MMNTTTASQSLTVNSRKTRMAAALSSCAVMGLAGLFLVGTAGCASKKKPDGSKTPGSAAVKQVAVDADVDARVSGAKSIASLLALHVEPLPGRTRDEHVSTMRAVLDDLALVLPLLKGQDPGGKWRQELHNIQTAANGLAGLPSDAAHEPYTDAGLRAAADVLGELADAAHYAGADQKGAVEALNKQLLELDRTKGAMHQLVVGDAARLTSAIVTALAAELEKEAAVPATSPTDEDALNSKVAPPGIINQPEIEVPKPAPAAPAVPDATPENVPAPEAPAPAPEAPAPAPEPAAPEVPAAAPEAPAPSPEAAAPEAPAPAPEAPAPEAPAADPAPAPAAEEANK